MLVYLWQIEFWTKHPKTKFGQRTVCNLVRTSCKSLFGLHIFFQALLIRELLDTQSSREECVRYFHEEMDTLGGMFYLHLD
jgi:hypothetical protein